MVKEEIGEGLRQLLDGARALGFCRSGNVANRSIKNPTRIRTPALSSTITKFAELVRNRSVSASASTK